MRLNCKYPLRTIGDERLIIIKQEDDANILKAVSVNDTSAWLMQSLADKEFSISGISQMLQERFIVDGLVADIDAAQWANTLINLGVIEK
jgi:hypothetical protein